MFIFDFIKKFLGFFILGLTLLCFVYALVVPTTVAVLILVLLILIFVTIAIDDDRFKRRR
ncbi:MAG TPA: hypothetical protein GXX38_08595 [Clostridia bacterium]|nr:hypothetical protein [Clostridia bacterium]